MMGTHPSSEPVRAPRPMSHISFSAITSGAAFAFAVSLSSVGAHAQGAPTIVWSGGGHSGVSCVAASPDGQTIATASSYDETLKLWRASDGVLLRTLAAHFAGIQAISFSPDGAFIASGADV